MSEMAAAVNRWLAEAENGFRSGALRHTDECNWEYASFTANMSERGEPHPSACEPRECDCEHNAVIAIAMAQARAEGSAEALEEAAQLFDRTNWPVAIAARIRALAKPEGHKP